MIYLLNSFVHTGAPAGGPTSHGRHMQKAGQASRTRLRSADAAQEGARTQSAAQGDQPEQAGDKQKNYLGKASKNEHEFVTFEDHFHPYQGA